MEDGIVEKLREVVKESPIVYRIVEEKPEYHEVEFRIAMEKGDYVLNNERLAEAISHAYDVSKEEILNEIKRIAERELSKFGLFSKTVSDIVTSLYCYYEFKVYKKEKGKEEIKTEIKDLTTLVANIVMEATKFAREVRKRTDVSDWIWNVAVLDVRKGKFVKVE